METISHLLEESVQRGEHTLLIIIIISLYDQTTQTTKQEKLKLNAEKTNSFGWTPND